MPPKFGNYLFRNLKGQSGAGASNPPSLEEAAELADQTILLRPEDFIDGDSGSGTLNWPSVNHSEIRVQFRDTNGLMEGRVVIAAGILRRNYPALVPPAIKDDVQFPVSLKTVVLQLQNCLRAANTETPTAPPTDFDTPIAQVAREDEGFSKLERAAQSDPARAETGNQPQLAEELSPFPLIREKPQSIPPNPPAVQVTWPSPAAPESRSAKIGSDPFKDLPNVGPRTGDRKLEVSSPDPEIRTSPEIVESVAPKTSSEFAAPVLDKPLRRVGLERLQEIFLTDDFLDARQVAKLLRAFPKVKGALILLEDGTVMGGDLPEGFNLGAAFAAPDLLRASRKFVDALNGSNVVAVTLLADIPISVFLEHRVCILIAHEGRGLLPGMRERIGDIAKALDAMYAPSEE
ncbi:MAG TPA: hypothetical protein VN857_05810 [Chthoniobacterales bacterium]|nr:hypothetical protein [Chthoniobacterales bacterium]